MGLAIGLGLGIPFLGTGQSLINPATLSPVWWYEMATDKVFSDTAGTTPVTANVAAAYVKDLSGNARHLIQTTGTSQGIYRTSGGVNWIEFDGSDDRYRVTYTSLGSAVTRVHAFTQVTWTAGDCLVSGGAGSTSALGTVLQNPTTPNIRAAATANVNLSGAPALGTPFVLAEVWNGANSKWIINNTTTTTGNPGALVDVGFTVGSQGSAVGTGFANMLWYGSIGFSSVLSDKDIAAVSKYMGVKAGLSI